MCGFVTLCDYSKNILENEKKIKEMNALIEKRGPDDEGYLFTPHCLMGHRRLSIIDLKNGQQPMSYTINNQTYHIVYNGELYNMMEIKNHLINLGYTFHTSSDTEVILASYACYREHCVDLFEGIFAFVIDDGERLFLARDQLGVKPLFYCLQGTMLIVASEIKCILKYLKKAIVNENGIRQLLALGPSLTPGETLYEGIYSLRPGYFMLYKEKIEMHCYWKLHDQKHTDNLQETIQHVRELVIESIQKQLLSDVPLCTMLSGGLDSSIITAVAYQYIQPLSTYSISYEKQNQYFKAYDYQTTMDDDYILDMLKTYPTHHHSIVLSQQDLIENLKQALISRDMPGMADIDSSFLLFSKEIRKKHKVCLSGECADEIFGGYPWFYKKELYHQPYFPWIRDIEMKESLLNEKTKKLDMKEYIIHQYQESLKEIPTQDKKKQLIYLNTQWFMQTLLTRTDSQTMNSSIEVRVPFASTKIIQYLYNMPKEYMFYNNEEKGILREAFKDLLPSTITHRKKNPYPKTHSPLYTNLICKKMEESFLDSSNILFQLFDKEQLIHFVKTKGQSIQYPWFGQLMMGPQLMAYFYQIYLWGQIYQIEFKI